MSRVRWAYFSFSPATVRRAVHLLSALVPFLYYDLLVPLGDLYSVSPLLFVFAALISVLIIDFFRIYFRWSVYGQRPYERARLSSLSFLCIGICVVLCFAANRAVATAIIISAAVADPLMGWLKGLRYGRFVVCLAGCGVVALCWWLVGAVSFILAWQLVAITCVTVLAECPNWFWCDDDLLMQLLPLLLITVMQ